MKTDVQEFTDKAGGKRIRVVALENGRILSSSTQGYSKKNDAIKAAIRSATAILENYAGQIII